MVASSDYLMSPVVGVFCVCFCFLSFLLSFFPPVYLSFFFSSFSRLIACLVDFSLLCPDRFAFLTIPTTFVRLIFKQLMDFQLLDKSVFCVVGCFFLLHFVDCICLLVLPRYFSAFLGVRSTIFIDLAGHLFVKLFCMLLYGSCGLVLIFIWLTGWVVAWLVRL